MNQQNSFNKRMEEAAAYIRLKYGHNKTVMAKNLGISQPSLSQLISGASQKPSSQTAKLLADRYKIDTLWLLTGEGVMELPGEKQPQGLIETLQRHVKALEERCDVLHAWCDRLTARLAAVDAEHADTRRRVLELAPEDDTNIVDLKTIGE